MNTALRFLVPVMNLATVVEYERMLSPLKEMELEWAWDCA
jgi:hypothetical protein